MNCIKCTKEYNEKDDDAYYCEICLEEKNKIAKEVDKKLASRPSEKPVSELQKYDSLKDNRGFVRANDLI